MGKRNLYIGLKYQKDIDSAPRIIFKYYSFNTDNIIKMLERYQIPVIHDRMLVRLLEQLPVGREIPEELYLVIAKIYKILYQHGYIKEKNH